MISAYNFNGIPSGTDQNAQAGLSQYAQQGQMALDPGQATVTAASPINAAAMSGLAKAFAASQQSQPANPAQAVLTNGAAMQPNVNGQNMGGVGPTVNNANAMASYNGMSASPTPTYAQQLGNFLSGSN